jgi:uncharacterized protein YdeI (YjbR/CyaY-like superfamily)
MSGVESAQPRFFASAAAFRAWLARNHATTNELWVGLWKKDSGRKGLTYEEAVEEALCYGWIDGLTKGHDELSYKQRFTPRKATSVWSAINVGKVERLKAAGRMAKPGLEAYAKRDPKRTGVYSFENRDVKLPAALEKRFRANRAAWTFFGKQPPGYRRLMTFWVASAKREETRERRLQQLIERSATGKRIE